MVKRVAKQMVGLEADGERIEQPLDDAYRKRWAADVLEQKQPSARAQHPQCLADRLPLAGNRAEPERADHRVEALVTELQGLGVADPQIGVASKLGRALARDREHLRAELDPGQAHPVAIEGEIASRARGDLEDIPVRLLAHPAAAVAEQDALEEPDPPVVAGRRLVLDPADALGLGLGGHRPSSSGCSGPSRNVAYLDNHRYLRCRSC